MAHGQSSSIASTVVEVLDFFNSMFYGGTFASKFGPADSTHGNTKWYHPLNSCASAASARSFLAVLLLLHQRLHLQSSLLTKPTIGLQQIKQVINDCLYRINKRIGETRIGREQRLHRARIILSQAWLSSRTGSEETWGQISSIDERGQY